MISEVLLINIDMTENDEDILTFSEKFIHKTAPLSSDSVKFVNEGSSDTDFSIIGEYDGIQIPMFSVQLRITKIKEGGCKFHRVKQLSE